MTVERSYLFAIVPEWVVFHPDLQPIDVRVYAVLDRHANKSARCWPGLGTVAEQAHCSVDTVRRSIRRLEDVGAVQTHRRSDDSGRQTSNTYVLAGDAPVHKAPGSGARDAGRDGAGVEGGTGAGDTLAPVPPEREREEPEPEGSESQRNDTPSSTDVDDPKKDPEYGFDRFWTTYPKRNGKRLARSDALVHWKRLSYDDKAAAWRGVQHYAAAVAADLTIAMDAFRWLRKRRWEDWQDAAVPDAHSGRPDAQMAALRAAAQRAAARDAEAAGGAL